MMKNLSLILNAVLFVAVGVLFYLHFSFVKNTRTENSPSQGSTLLASERSIVYINIDSLLNNYGYFSDMQDDFAKKQAEMEAELNQRSKQYEASALDYQNKVQKGLVTRREAQELEQQLYQQQQELLKLRDDLTMQLQEEEQVSNRKLINNIMEYLVDYNTKYNYQFIFSNSFGDNLLYANDKLDITKSVLQGINAKYQEETKKK